MKILTIAIPSYNSMDYMRNCIESLLPGGEDVEILIVDDGSKDETPAIADEYEAKYPGIATAEARACRPTPRARSKSTSRRQKSVCEYKIAKASRITPFLSHRQLLPRALAPSFLSHGFRHASAKSGW